MWGPDAHQFRPERWFEMDEKVESPVGVYGNLYGDAWGFTEPLSIDIVCLAPRSLVVLGAALGGDSRGSINFIPFVLMKTGFW